MMVTTGAVATRRSPALTSKRLISPAPAIQLPEPITASPEDPPVHHVRVALDTRLRALLAHDPGARTGADAEDVHQMRVSVRRMRAALKAARPLLDAQWADGLRDELRWLGRALGPVRDLDVLLPRLRRLTADLPAPDREVAEQLFGVLSEEYLKARQEMLTTLSEPRYVTLLERLADAVRLPLPTPSATRKRPTVIELVRAEYQALRKAVRRAGATPSDETLHQLRIKTKRLRYTGELAEPALGQPVRRLLDATAHLQEVLGDHQDACVAQRRLRQLATQTDGPHAALVAGRLLEREHLRAERERSRWWTAWEQVSARAERL